MESGQHLLQYLTYIDLNMVRNGVVSHPSEWPFGGYNEIQKPRKKCVLIAYQKLAELAGFASYESFQRSHKELFNESLVNGNNCRQAHWTESIAVGSNSFVEAIKDKLGVLAKGRKVIEKTSGFQLREEIGRYSADFDSKKEDIWGQNTYFLDMNH